MKALINLSGETSWLNSSKVVGVNLKFLLEAVTLINQCFLRKYKVPLLYESGVRYAQEPDGQIFFRPDEPSPRARDLAESLSGRVEDFATIPAVLKRGWGDCDDLAPFRVSELRERGEKARIRIQWKRVAGGAKLFHIVVRRENGDIEDPSAILGMKIDSRWKNPRAYR